MKRLKNNRWALLLAGLGVLGLAPLAMAQQQSPQVQKLIEAEQLVQQGKPDEALRITRELLEEDPESPDAYFLSGLAYQAKGKAEAPGDAKTAQYRSALDSFVKAVDFRPGWGIAHRLASMTAYDVGNVELSWEHAIKAHQSGTDMSDAFGALGSMSEKPADLEQQLAVKRVFVAPMNTETFENQGDRSLGSADSTRRNSSASSNTDVGRRVLNEAAPDIAQFQVEANRQFANSRTFGLVQRQEMADLIMVFEVDSIADNTRRRTRGYLKLMDAKSGEEAYRRRVEFTDIASRADLNRDFSQIMRIVEEWAAENLR